MSQPIKNKQDPSTAGGGSRFTRTGIVLMFLSGVLWFSLFAIPFLPFTAGEKALLAAAIFVGVQISWWLGAALAGPRVIRKAKEWLRRSK
ncbi:MAG: transporter suffix domain-containing protein [Fuerstiella sp.]